MQQRREALRVGALAELDVPVEQLSSDGLLAAWTGDYRTDVFWVDDLEVVRDALS